MLIITTSRSVLHIDIDSGESVAVHRGAGLYFGVARDRRSRWYVAARGRMMSDEDGRDGEDGRVLVFDRRWRYTRALRAPFSLRDLHGIAWFDGRLWATCSRDDFIAVFDGRKWDRWRPFPSDPIDGRDRRHYNTIVADGQVVRLVAHNHGASDLHFFDRRNLEWISLLPLGRLAHNSWVQNGEYFTCSSEEGAIVGSRGTRVETGGFPRGFAELDDGRRIVGINEHAPRAARDDTTSRLRVFDRNWRSVGELELDGEGMVLEIVDLDRKRPSGRPSISRRTGAPHHFDATSNRGPSATPI